MPAATASGRRPRAAAAPGRRQPLPPRHRRRRRGSTPRQALAAAAAVGVTRIVQIGCDLPGARWAVEAAAEHDALVAGVALHPNEAPRLAADGSSTTALAEIERLASAHDKVRAVGETGLDHFRTGDGGPARAQEESFRRHIDLAKRLDKTLVIHDRDAHDDVLRVLDEEGAPERWVMHCFSGDADFARRVPGPRRPPLLRRHGHLQERRSRCATRSRSRRATGSWSRPTRPTSPRCRYRGRPNASYLVPLTVRAMAEVRGDDLEELCRRHRRQHRGRVRRRLVAARPLSDAVAGSRRETDHIGPNAAFEFASRPASLSSCDCWPGSGAMSGQREDRSGRAVRDPRSHVVRLTARRGGARGSAGAGHPRPGEYDVRRIVRVTTRAPQQVQQAPC